MIMLHVTKYIIKPYISKQLLDDIILLTHGKALSQKSTELIEHQEKKVEEIDNLKDSLLTLFTHELKTPLNAILNFSKHSYKLVAKSDINLKDKILYEIGQINSNSKIIAELVENNGRALKDDEKLFEFFEQFSSDTMIRGDQGCGVGLYLVKEIIDILGYNIKVDKSSTLGGAKILVKGSRRS